MCFVCDFRTPRQCCDRADEVGPRGASADRTVPIQAEEAHGKFVLQLVYLYLSLMNLNVLFKEKETIKLKRLFFSLHYSYGFY